MNVLVCLLMLLVPALAAAQTTVAAQTAAAASSIAAPAVVIPLGTRVGELSTGYDDGGRRDPFGSLVVSKRAAVPSADGRPRTGLSALSISDVIVKGIVRNGTTMLAILEAPGKQSFVTRVKDRLLDGTIVSIDREGVVFSDRSGGAPTEVRKTLRPIGEELR